MTKTPESQVPQQQPFYGSVTLRNWCTFGGGKYNVVTGLISVRESVDALGIKTARTEATWFAMIQGPTTTFYAPGCEVLGIWEHHDESSVPTAWVMT